MMISLEEAKERLSKAIKPLHAERLPLQEAFGRISAAAAIAPIDLPTFDNSAMDGYAVRAEDLREANDRNPVLLKLIGRIGAGALFESPVSSGTCVRIFTGSVLPTGSDAVVMQEDVSIEEDHIRFVESAAPFENVRLKGEDIREGTKLIEPGERITSTHIALNAATGRTELLVHQTPRVALLATGDELCPPGDPLPPGKIYESNRFMLTALLRDLTSEVSTPPLVPDDLESTVAALDRAFAKNDVVVTTGGVSVGEFDFVKEAFVHLGGKIDLWKVAIRPGKPFVFGTLGGKHLFGLPGNPVSALVTFLVLVRPALLRMMGATSVDLPQVQGELLDRIANPGDRRHFVRCCLANGKVRVAGRQASHMLGAIGGANCLIDVPPATTLNPGTIISAQLWALPVN